MPPIDNRTYSGPVFGKENVGYFTNFTITKALLYVMAGAYVIGASVVSLIEPYLELPCDVPTALEFGNPAYDASPCRQYRYFQLLFFTRQECSYFRRLVWSIFLGGKSELKLLTRTLRRCS